MNDKCPFLGFFEQVPSWQLEIVEYGPNIRLYHGIIIFLWCDKSGQVCVWCCVCMFVRDWIGSCLEVLKPWPSVWLYLEIEPLRRNLRLKKTKGGDPKSVGSSVLTWTERHQQACSLCSVHRGKVMWGHSEKGALCIPFRGAHQTLTCWHLSGTSSLQKCDKVTQCSGHQPLGFCCGSPSKWAQGVTERLAVVFLSDEPRWRVAKLFR